MDLRSIINNEGADITTQNKAQPATPVQARPSPGPYREYSQHSQPQPAPPSRHSSQDYGVETKRFTSPTAYQGTFQGRPPPPPPLQPLNSDLRSPAASSHYSAQSPFRHTPSSSTSGGQNATPQSPAQVHQYPHSQRHRESYPQNTIIPQSQQLNYPQASPVPLTPPIGSSTVANLPSQHQQQHQRPQSSHSSPTPTSAQSQSNIYTQQFHESPIGNNTFPSTPFTHDQSQRSHPGTPFRQPATIQRQPTGGYPFPTSPYQQRAQSLGVTQENIKNEGISPSPSMSIAPTTPAPHIPDRQPAMDPRRSSQSEREHSLSVSPKTTIFVPAKTESADQVQHATPALDSAPIPAKRKIDDRRSSGSRTLSGAPNGDQSINNKSQSPQEPRKRRRYNEPPIWAQSWMRHKMDKRQLTQASSGQVNGKPVSTPLPESSHPQNLKREPSLFPASATFDDLLGPWEPSISDTTPVNDLTKAVADFLYLQVVNRPDWGELESRGVQVEIEAKLGQLIDKETNQRYYLPVVSECVLAPSNRISFRSSMTEDQHKKMNGFLNELVTQTHPSNLNRPKPRVPIQYAHRRERDSFYELPQSIVQTLPATIQHFLKQTSRHAPKVRVTYDQKTGQVLARIIKTRVQDLDIYIPNSPLDCRISVNLEMKYDGDTEALARGSERQNQPDRNKDRLSYTQSHYQIDLTQVTSATGEKEHELEIEIDTKTLVEQGLRLQTAQPHRYDALVEGLINNIHVLTKELSIHEV